jgi:ribonuclease BN (tRNA processing enzyme)
VQIQILGSGGWMPTDARETTCIYVRDGDHVLLLDAGTGVRRLATEPQLLEGVRRITVALTHFHIDHLMGLPFLIDFDVEREIWGGGLALEGIPTVELVHRLFDPPIVGQSPGEVHELAPPGAAIGPFTLEARIQPRHPNQTLALRVNRELALCTDTAYDEENIAFVRGARVLCHESFHAGDTTDDLGHTASGDAGRLARAAGVERLVLTHVNPYLRDDEELLRFARPVFPDVAVARDGMIL